MTAHAFTFFISYVYKKIFNIASVIQTMERDAILFTVLFQKSMSKFNSYILAKYLLLVP